MWFLRYLLAINFTIFFAFGMNLTDKIDIIGLSIRTNKFKLQTHKLSDLTIKSVENFFYVTETLKLKHILTLSTNEINTKESSICNNAKTFKIKMTIVNFDMIETLRSNICISV